MSALSVMRSRNIQLEFDPVSGLLYGSSSIRCNGHGEQPDIYVVRHASHRSECPCRCDDQDTTHLSYRLPSILFSLLFALASRTFSLASFSSRCFADQRAFRRPAPSLLSPSLTHSLLLRVLSKRRTLRTSFPSSHSRCRCVIIIMGNFAI